MKFEIFLFVICAGLIYNTYHDNKYIKIIKGWKKYLNMAGIAFIGISIYLYVKKDPSGSYDMFSRAGKLMSHMPVDKNSITMAQMMMNSQQPKPHQRQVNPHTNQKNKRCVSETKKKYVASSQDWKCKNCLNKLEATFEVDHVVELQDGGTNDISNLVALCRNCHGKKGMFRKILN
tara:strand:- start:6272 stop:6799 length:528 start_codon:yes stop_codon:yes gene_type:complete